MHLSGSFWCVCILVATVRPGEICAQSWGWTRQWGSSSGAGSTSDAYARAVAVSVDGQVYVAGWTDGSLEGQSSSGDLDFFLLQYSSSGVRQWTIQRGTSRNDIARAVDVSVDGQAYMAGGTRGELDGHVSSGSYDAFLMKYSSTAGWQWTRQTGSSNSETANAMAVSVDGQVYIAGTTEGSLDKPTGRHDIFLMQYSSSGVWQWTRQRGGTSGNLAADDYALAVAVSIDGQVYVAGFTEGSLDEQVFFGDSDVFLMQYSSSGVWQWTRQRGCSNADRAYGAAVSIDGKVYIAGRTGGSLDGQSSSGGIDAFLMQYSSSGEWQWTRQWGSSVTDDANAVAVSVDGQVFVAGQSSSSSYDVFLTQYSSSGEQQWTLQRSGSFAIVALAVAVSVDGKVYVAGYTRGSIDGQSYSSGYDAFLMQFESPSSFGTTSTSTSSSRSDTAASTSSVTSSPSTITAPSRSTVTTSPSTSSGARTTTTSTRTSSHSSSTPISATSTRSSHS
eukprot:2159169-Amphidinium_carterae.1